MNRAHSFRPHWQHYPRPTPENRIRVVHGLTAGRARLEVWGLYQSASLKRAIESALAAHPGILSVAANPLTGRVLVGYSPTLGLSAVLQALESALPAVQVSRTEPPVRRPAPAAASPAPSLASTRPWHLLEASAVMAELETSAHQGLSVASAEQRLRRQGPNVLPRVQPRSELAIALGQFNSLPVALLAGSAVVALATGGLADAVVIVGVVAINAVIGYVTESRAERTITALADVGSPTVQVLRDGQPRPLSATGIVSGDVLLLALGARVAADARLVTATNLSVDESALTGESLPTVKSPARLDAAAVALADRLNMVYMGTAVTGGSGLAVVVATGRQTELGTIQTLVGETRPPATPMQRQLGKVGNQLVWLSAGICGVVFGIGVLRGYGGLAMLKAAISLAVAAVPEGLPTVATTTLALGIRDMRRRKVLVRNLAAVETLGSVQVICLDKTGTLTENRMSVTAVHADMQRLAASDGLFRTSSGRIDPDHNAELQRLLQVAVLCNETEVEGAAGSYTLNGSATERALVHMALAAGVNVQALRQRNLLLHVEYRAEYRPYMSTLHDAGDGRRLLAVKGSPAEVLKLCRWYGSDGLRHPLTEPIREHILQENDFMAGEALRVLGFACSLAADGEEPLAQNLTWLGLAGMADAIRPGVAELMGLLHQAGIRTVMITGDQSGTAFAIGRALNISGNDHLEILDSGDLERIEPELMSALAQKVHVFSRVSPAHKLQIVQGLQRAGKVVAMTGDGINDAPALRAADIGVAMGSAGTEVARSVADVVLENDELATLIDAVAQGRTIYGNIRKSIHFLVSTNLSEIAVMLTAIGAGLGTPLSTMHLLWINLMSDIFPALALAVEPPEPDVLRRPPRDSREPLLRGRDFKRYGLESLAITTGAMAAYGVGLARYGSGPAASTNAFMTLTLAQLVHAYSCRSESHGIFSRQKLPANRRLDLAVGSSLAIQLASALIPGLRGLLGTTLPGAVDWAAIAAGAALPFLVNEATKSGGSPLPVLPTAVVNS